MTLTAIIGSALRSAFPALYPDGTLHTVTRTEAENGDVTTTGADSAIKVQREPCTERMRQAAGYTDTDVALIVMQTGGVTVTTDDRVTDGDGRLWLVASVEYDAALSHWLLRGTSA